MVARASHVVLTVRDLQASRRFYTEVVGLAVTAEEDGTLFLRGLEEACHHSLVLQQTTEPRGCAALGMRVQADRDLDRAATWFAERGCPVEWVERPHQGRTLRVHDPFGLVVEFCATMDVLPRLLTQFHLYRGGAAQRLDQYQILTPDVRGACEFWMAAGFRLTEYVAPEGSDDYGGVFLQRKGNPHDIVFFRGSGQRLHHVAFTSVDLHTMLRACDVAGALGYGADVERGPGRHGPGHALYVYLRDPDGHRVELFNTHYLITDIELEPVRWDPRDASISVPWGLPAQRRWFEQATPFLGVPLREPTHPPSPVTLERFLAERAPADTV